MIFFAHTVTHEASGLVRAKKSADEYDPFVAEDDELFPTSSDSPHGSSPASSVSASAEQSKKLSDSARLERFEELLEFVKTHVGRRVVRPDARQVRNSAWTHLFGLATTEEQLRRVAGLFTTWTESKRQWNDNHVEVFVRRCVELDCAKHALDVFSDRSKYGFENLTERAAQVLLKGLHTKHSLTDVTTLLVLYSLYNLPPPTATPFRAQCSPLPAQTLEAVGPLQADKREAVWAKYALAKVQKGLEKEGEDVSWLKQWRAASGHLEPSLRDQKLAAKRELQAAA
ncbi:hypothetical protein EWM64_g9779 [Hericium alpestre]|uniref:Uncharacterized protein n=1 Tax=Hericium alpestre TaxID=135208 RepID=A0A4Y9ZK11_9AGAM|nr:hypothetical protein EWM64_g9779 [Hericium alpestre]